MLERGPACMAKPYSNDLRKRVAKTIAAGETCRVIAAQYEVAPSTVVKWSKRLKETGSPAPAKFGGHKKCSLEPHRDFVLAQVEEVPHLTLHKLKDMLADQGIAVSHDTVWRFLKREGRSFKKTAYASEQHRVDVARKRQRGFF
ncbi:transposase [Hyphomicrobium sp.]|uniref:transposase n=1 Tax=Hyphomicrobium sp. TaxID=82 RepID=UPI00345909C8